MDEPKSAAEPVPDEKAPIVKKGTASIRGVVKYPWGTVKDASVVLGETSVRTDKNGNYEIIELSAGSYTLDAKTPFPGYEAQPRSVQIVDGESKVVDIYMDFKKTTVEGHICDAEGKPIAGAFISGVCCGSDVETTTSDEKGYFKYDRASPGKQFIRVNKAGYTPETRDFTTNDDKETTLEFHLAQATCKIQGTVRDANSKPMQADVALSSPAGIILERTTSKPENGHYEFTVSPGEYNLLATHPEHKYKGWHGSVSGEIEVNFNLEPKPPQIPRRSTSRHEE
jgi:uncharacterized surface anchored protein